MPRRRFDIRYATMLLPWPPRLPPFFAAAAADAADLFRQRLIYAAAAIFACASLFRRRRYAAMPPDVCRADIDIAAMMRACYALMLPYATRMPLLMIRRCAPAIFYDCLRYAADY